MGLARIASSHFLIPGGMKGPSPCLTDCTPGHRLESARLADCAEIDVNKNSAEHDQGRDVMQDVTHRNGNSAECVSTHPEHDSGDEINDRSDQDLPELDFLPRIEKTCVGRLELL